LSGSFFFYGRSVFPPPRIFFVPFRSCNFFSFTEPYVFFCWNLLEPNRRAPPLGMFFPPPLCSCFLHRVVGPFFSLLWVSPLLFFFFSPLLALFFDLICSDSLPFSFCSGVFFLYDEVVAFLVSSLFAFFHLFAVPDSFPLLRSPLFPTFRRPRGLGESVISPHLSKPFSSFGSFYFLFF